MGRRLILDTTTLIALERGTRHDRHAADPHGDRPHASDPHTLDPSAFDADDIAVAAITIAEFQLGVELADTAERAQTRARVLAAIIDATTVLDYTDRTAAVHARLMAHVRRTGTPRGAHDLIIAAHAIEHRRAIVSRDAAARFADLPGLQTVMPQPTPEG